MQIRPDTSLSRGWTEQMESSDYRDKLAKRNAYKKHKCACTLHLITLTLQSACVSTAVLFKTRRHQGWQKLTRPYPGTPMKIPVADQGVILEMTKTLGQNANETQMKCPGFRSCHSALTLSTRPGTRAFEVSDHFVTLGLSSVEPGNNNTSHR